MRLFTALTLLVATPVAAHDFWLDLPRHHQPAPAPIPVRFLIGDPGEAEPWDTRWPRIVALRGFGPGGVVDHQASIRLSGPGAYGGATITLPGPGTHVIAFESALSENDITAKEFNAYAALEGLTPAIERRRRDKTTGARGRETYSRRAKALVQVGAETSADATRAIGQTLEITPEVSPYSLAPDAPLVLRVDYHGRPLAGAKVILVPLDGPARAARSLLTDARGRASFVAARAGRWRATTVWTQPIKHPRAEFDTVFASLTFGYRGAP